uniref:Uncharacterized protein n=1 Tax=Glossina pallidipes TaxID=7398 RepID=A0A1A9ZQL5_GLOPL
MASVERDRSIAASSCASSGHFVIIQRQTVSQIVQLARPQVMLGRNPRLLTFIENVIFRHQSCWVGLTLMFLQEFRGISSPFGCRSSMFEDIIDPKTVEEALSAKTQEWYDTMYDEYSSLMKNRTWDIADILKNRSTVCREWVFKSKIKPEKTIDKKEQDWLLSYIQNGKHYTDKSATPARQGSISLL